MRVSLRGLGQAVFLLAAPLASWSIPISSCNPNQQGLFACNLYETDSHGFHTERRPAGR